MVIEIVAAVIRRGEEVLIARRAQGQHLAGLWEFPGGKVKPDETHAACLVRECREELAIEIEPGPLLERTEHAYPDRRVILHFYLCRHLSGEPAAMAAERLRWVAPADLRDFAFPEANASVLERLMSLGVQE